MQGKIFAPGCALMLYKPELAYRIHNILKENLGDMVMLMTCCRHDPELKTPASLINICPGCDKRFRSDYVNCSTVSLWEILASSDFFPFPDYGNKEMTIIDACPTRDQGRVHKAVRILLQKMNIRLIEPEKTAEKSTCCGDSFYGTIPIEKVKNLMIKKAREMPVDDIVVYCVSCAKSMFTGGRIPRYLIDLLFDEPTIPRTSDPEKWHIDLDLYIESH